MAYSDLIQTGNLGLMKVVDKFDPELGNNLILRLLVDVKIDPSESAEQYRAIMLPVHVRNLKREDLSNHSILQEPEG